MKVYMVSGNTYYDGYGRYISCFGIFSDKKSAEDTRDLAIKRIYEEQLENPYTKIDSIEDVEVDIIEMEIDSIVDIPLGGYCE